MTKPKSAKATGESPRSASRRSFTRSGAFSRASCARARPAAAQAQIGSARVRAPTANAMAPPVATRALARRLFSLRTAKRAGIARRRPTPAPRPTPSTAERIAASSAEAGRAPSLGTPAAAARMTAAGAQRTRVAALSVRTANFIASGAGARMKAERSVAAPLRTSAAPRARADQSESPGRSVNAAAAQPARKIGAPMVARRKVDGHARGSCVIFTCNPATKASPASMVVATAETAAGSVSAPSPRAAKNPPTALRMRINAGERVARSESSGNERSANMQKRAIAMAATIIKHLQAYTPQRVVNVR